MHITLSRILALAVVVVLTALAPPDASAAGSGMRVQSGSYVGDGQSGRTVSGLGFAPDLVIVQASNRAAFARSSTMGPNLAKPLGTRTGLVADLILTLDTDGFTLGSDASVNGSGETYYWVAFQAAAQELTVGVYTGNGVDDRNITGLGFRPAYVFVMSESNQHAIQRFENQGFDLSFEFRAGAEKTDRIQYIISDGFQIGADRSVNELGVPYHYVAWGPVAQRVNEGAYFGDGTDDRDITGVGFAPDAVIVRHRDANATVYRTPALSGDNTLVVDSGTTPNAIQALLPDGFQIGSDATVNTSPDTYYWAAFRDAISVDLELAKSVNDSMPDELQTITYTLGVQNLGPNGATGVEITDVLPDGVTFVSATPSQGVYLSGSGSWVAGNLGGGTSATLDLEVQVDSGTAGARISNTAYVSALDQRDASAVNDTALVDIVVRGADVALTKTVDDTTPEEGQSISYTISVTNDGPLDADTLEITDVLPAGVTYQSHVPSQGSYDPVSGVWNVGALGALSGATLVIDASVDAGTAGTSIRNTASVTSASPGDSAPGNESDEADIVVRGADLSIQKTVDEPNPNEGDTVTYTVTVSNAGPDSATSITVIDLLPAGLTFVSDAPSQGSYASVTGEWTLGDLNASAGATLELVATVDPGTAGTSISNTATIAASTPTDPSTGNDSQSAEITVQAADLVVTKGVDDTNPNEGDAIAYTIVITNDGPDDATGIVLTDVLPAGVTFQTDGASQGSYDDATGIWSVGTIANGGGATLVLNVSVNPGTSGSTISNVATITSVDQADPAPGNESDSTDITIQSADLSVLKVVNNAAPVEGATVTYTVAVSNAGPDAATGIEVSDLLPLGVTYQSHLTSQGSYDSGTGLWTAGSIGGGSNATLTLVAKVDSGTAGSTITNTATVSAVDQQDPAPGNESDSADIVPVPIVGGTSADLSVTKEVDDPTPNVGQTVTYTITLTNDGPDPASGVEIVDLLPSGLTYQSDTPSQGTYASGTGTWTVGTVDPVESVTLVLTATVDAGTAATTIVNSAAVTSVNEDDPSPGDESASADITVQGSDLVVTAVVDDAAPNEGQTVTFTISVTNSGPDAATGVAVLDELPTGLTYQLDTPSQGTYASGSGVWDIGTIGSSSTATLSLAASVDPGTGGSTMENTGTVVAVDQGDPSPGDESDTATLTVQSADLVVSNVVDDGTPNEGQTIRYTVTITNAGPDAATGVELASAIPQGLTYQSHSASQGSYSNGTGVWSVGTVDASSASTLFLDATVDAGTGGTTIGSTATVTAVDQTDPSPGDETDSVDVTVQSADLTLSKLVDDATPAEGQSVTYTITVTNHGPDTATGVEVTDALPAGITYESDAPTQGSYASGTGIWNVGSIPVSSTVTLELSGAVAPATAGSVITNTASVSAVDQADPAPGDESDTADIVVRGADLSVSKTVDETSPSEGDLLTYTITVRNLGPDDATEVAVTDQLPLALAYESDAPDRGVYLAGSGLWAIGELAVGDSAKLVLTASVDAGTSGATITNVATISGSSTSDPVPDNDVATVDVVVTSRMTLVADFQLFDSLPPGGALQRVMSFSLINEATVVDTLESLAIANATVGPGTDAERDAEWSALELHVVGQASPIAVASMSGGRVVFSGLDLAIPPAANMQLEVRGGASLMARDGDRLDLVIVSPADVVFAHATEIDAEWPVDPLGEFEVDGMTSMQIGLGSLDSASLLTGSTRQLTLSFRIPANGYTPDVLQRISVLNEGDAQPGTDIQRVEAWIDQDDDGSFDDTTDVLLGDMPYTGDRWIITGLASDVPLSGLGVFVTCDIGEQATEGRTVRMALPRTPDEALGMASGNDGPNDTVVKAGLTQTITTADRVTLSSIPIPPGTVSPGETDVLLLSLSAHSSYAVPKTLTTLRVTNGMIGTGTIAELDAEITRLLLRADGNGDGTLGTLTDDPIIGTSFFTDGLASFTGIGSVIGAGESLTYFVTADLSVTRSADGDIAGAHLDGPESVIFSDDTAIAAGWPLDSGASATIDGMIRAQIIVGSTPSTTLGPSEGPALAFDLVIPDNGYADDVLNGLTLRNDGTSTPSDLSDVRLWRDGGDAVFDAGSVDDVDLGNLFFTGTSWATPFLADTLSGSGTRYFASVTAGATPDDSTSVRFTIPVGGLSVASGNDGPTDNEVESSSSVLLSTARLLAELDLGPDASTIGGTVTATLSVRNVGPAAITGITPTIVETSGTGTLSPLSGPSPASIDLAPDERSAFVWTFRSDAVGTVRLAARAEGIESGSDLPRRSLTVESDVHTVFEEAQFLDVFAIESMPFSVNRGQTDVVPLSFTFSSPNAAGSSDVRLLGLRVHVEDEVGMAIAPADLFSRVVVAEGAEQYLNKTALETSGGEIDLTFSEPAVLETSGLAGQAMTLSVAFDIAASTEVPNFRVGLLQASWIVAEDATSGAPVASILQSGTYPVFSGLARVVGVSRVLEVSGGSNPDETVTLGQDGVTALDLRLVNTDPGGLAADVRVTEFDISLVDTTGAPIASPGDHLERIRVQAPLQTLLDRGMRASDDTTMTLSLTTPLSVPVNTVVPISIEVDVADSSPLGPVRVLIGSHLNFEARDTNSGASVLVEYPEDPTLGGVLTVQSPAQVLAVSGDGLLPAVLTVGDTDVPAMSLQLRNPGAPGTSAVRCDSLTFALRDDRDDPLAPGVFVRRVTVMDDSTAVGELVDPPTTLAPFTVPVSGVSIAAGESVALEIRLDIESLAPPSFIVGLLRDSGIHAVEANLGSTLAVTPETGQTFPISTNLTRLQSPPRELRVGLTSLMPAVLVPDGAAFAVANLRLMSPEEEVSGPIRIEGLDLDLASADLTPIPFGDAVASVVALVADTVWTTSVLTPGQTQATLMGPPLEVTPGALVPLQIQLTLRDDSPLTSMRVGLEADGVRVVQPESAVLTVAVEPEDGSSFPFWTEPGYGSGATLAGSWSNFPNPFAAGREETRFVFFLEQPASVSLRIFTARGERVRTVVNDERLGPGLYQEHEWDGRNGRGDTVRNGVYVAALDVAFADGTRERLLRKVAVIR